MFPDLEDYDTKDIRSLLLYAWHFELYGVKELIENTNNNLNERIKVNIDKSLELIDDWEEHDKSLRKVQMYHSIKPLAFQSFLLTLYSILEASLDGYCNTCKKYMGLKINLEDFKDKGITRSINYLEKVIEIETIKSDYLWGKMIQINDLRNDLIHRCGSVSKKKSKKTYSEELSVEVIDGRIGITYENIIQIYDYIEKFMRVVFSRHFTNKNKTLSYPIDLEK
ncbi:hypothetical protein [Paenibacillus durus]|uniref:MAE-28990/MAE-18760-like HEPN domain-containing protein n=1 Tax=Paenibacillus durus TaxID=44251 RepID=A0A089HRS3_PAEDU|nr:hypothetical protein [Paenibacillus durus]AIQ13395.1 hypothetical protein PDUR_16830 [Paenibacillus durus]